METDVRERLAPVHAPTAPAPLFTIVLATRDRPTLFAQALNSVALQNFDDTEIVVVNDGSSSEALAQYEGVLQRARAVLGLRLCAYQLVRRPRGHGQSYSLNFGAERARGEYLCFLDDDDLWIDLGHLRRAAQVIRHAKEAGRGIDLYMTNQQAWRQGQVMPGPTWLEGLAGQLVARGRAADGDGAFAVDVADLLGSGGFCHLNCLCVRRELFLGVGGMDEGIRWECDREIFLRLLDSATHAVHHPAITGKHHVPDPKLGQSMTTSLNNLERRLWQLRVLDKASLLLQNPLLRAHGRLHRGYTLKRIAEDLAAHQDWHSASFYAIEGLAALPTFKWLLFTLSCLARRLVNPGSLA